MVASLGGAVTAAVPGRICLSLFGSQESICENIRSYGHDAGMFEIRVDLSEKLDFSRIRNMTALPLLFTAQSSPELLTEAVPYADFLDAGPVPDASWPETKTIVSLHTAEGEPEQLWARMHSHNRLTKIVFDTQDYATISRLLRLDRLHSPRGICFSMGEAGAFSRILSVFRGAPWMYASAKGAATAPGQFSIDDLTSIYRLFRFSTEPGVFGIVGNPVAHSRSPEFHNRRFADRSLPWIYLPFFCNDLRSLFAAAADFGVLGFSITAPFKEQAAALVDQASPEVTQLNSCNTVCRKNGEWVGTNTDVVGVRALLERLPKFRRALILGAGGAARAAACAVRPLVEQLVILNRTPEKAVRLAAQYQSTGGPLESFAACDCDLLIQTTSCGMREDESPVDGSLLHSGCVVVDAIYEPAETTLLKKARERGCHVINGTAWFEAQAEAQFRWWLSELSS